MLQAPASALPAPAYSSPRQWRSWSCFEPAAPTPHAQHQSHLCSCQPGCPATQEICCCKAEGHTRAVRGEHLCCMRSHPITLLSCILPKLWPSCAGSAPFQAAHWSLPAVAHCYQAGPMLPAAAPAACTKQQTCHHGPSQGHCHAVHSFTWLEQQTGTCFRQHCWAQICKAKIDRYCWASLQLHLELSCMPVCGIDVRLVRLLAQVLTAALHLRQIESQN